MPRSIRLLVFAVAIALLAQSVWADSPKVSQAELAKKLVDQMAAGDFEQAVAPFDPTMQRGAPRGETEAGLGSPRRPFWSAERGGRDPEREDRAAPSRLCRLPIRAGQARGQGGLHRRRPGYWLVLSAGGRVQGSRLRRSCRVHREPDRSRTRTVGAAGHSSLPKGEGPFPAIVLVHGSGPNDRDETIGPCKPFRDLAQGLSSQGIAVLRYEKRTKAHPAALALLPGGITVKEETVDDAAAAVGLLAAHEKIDPKRIFVLGHSLGGSLLPRIAAVRGDIAGLVSLAGSTRPLEDLLLEQVRYLLRSMARSATRRKRSSKSWSGRWPWSNRPI